MVNAVQKEVERVVRSLTERVKIIQAMTDAGVASWEFVVYNCDGSFLCRGEGGDELMQVSFGQVYGRAMSLDTGQCMLSQPNSPEVITSGVYWVAHVSQRGLVCVVAIKPRDDIAMDEHIPGRRDGKTYREHMVQQAENAAVLLGIGLGHLATEVRVLVD